MSEYTKNMETSDFFDKTDFQEEDGSDEEDEDDGASIIFF